MRIMDDSGKGLLRSAAAALAALMFYSCSGADRNGSFTGVVEGTSVQVPALTGGRIIEMLVDTGDMVSEGEVLARIDTTDLDYQRAQLDAVLDEIGVQEEIAATSRSRAESELEYVKKRFDRMSSLLEAGSVTQQAVDDSRNALENARSVFLTASRQVSTVRAKKEQAAAQLALIEKKISDAAVESPIAGIISAKYYESGEAVPQMMPVCEVIHTDVVWVKVYVGETFLPSVAAGQKVRVAVDGIDKVLEGRVAWISPKAEFTPKQVLTPEVRMSLVYAVKVTIDNREGILKHGMPVEVRF